MARKYVRGDRETLAAMRRIMADIYVPMQEAGREALKPTLAAAKANVPRKTGQLRRSLQIRRNTKAPRLRPKFRVGPFASDGGLFKHLTRLANILEFGRQANANGLGAIAPRAWMRQAFESTKHQIIKTYGEKIGPAFERRAAKNSAKIGKGY